MSPEISIVMPVHNTECYLPEALDSLIAQTFGNFELICVDDGSTDGSAALLKAYQSRNDWQYPMQVLTHSQARGAAVSRNDGMALARGTYLIFLDSDDRFNPTMLEKAWQACRENDADVAMFGVRYWYPYQGRIEMDHFWEKVRQRQELLPGGPVFGDLSGFPLLPFLIELAPWNKLVHRRLLERGSIQFQDIPNANDVFYSYSVSVQSQRVVFVDEPLLDYRFERVGNLSSTRNVYKNCLPYALDKCWALALALHFAEPVYRGLLNYMVRSLYQVLSPLAAEARELFQTQLREEFFPRWGVAEKVPDYFYTYNLYDFCQRILSGADCPNYFEGLLATSGAQIQALIQQVTASGKRVALWGAGKYGRMALERLDQMGFRLDAVVDASPQKQGTDCCGYRIQPYEAVSDRVDMILITNSKWRAGIEEQTQGRQEVVDLMEILENLQAFA